MAGVPASSRGGGSPVVATVYSYVELTTTISVTATSAATATTLATAAAVTFDGATQVEVQFFAAYCLCAANAGGNQLTFDLYLDGSAVANGALGIVNNAATTNLVVPVRLARVLTPAAGSRTYGVRAHRSNANCTVDGASGSGILPGFIRVVAA